MPSRFIYGSWHAKYSMGKTLALEQTFSFTPPMTDMAAYPRAPMGWGVGGENNGDCVVRIYAKWCHPVMREEFCMLSNIVLDY